MNSLELDLVILKNILSNKKIALDFANEGDAKLFSPSVWNFANVIIGYIRTYKEIPTLKVITEKLSKGNNDKIIENISKIWAQVETTPHNEKEFKHELEKLKKRFAEQQILSTKEFFSKLEPGTIDINKALNELQKTSHSIKSINESKSYDSKNIKDYLPVFVDKFNAKKDNPQVEFGLKTNYSFFDFATNGVRAADFILIAGESGFGKSLFLNNIAIQMWLQNNKVGQISDFSLGKDIAYFSLEMPYEDCFNRFISRLSGVPSRNIENCCLTREEFQKVKTALDFIKNYPHSFRIIDIADANANDLENILIECLERGESFDSLFVDYLGIMKTNKHSDEADWLKQGVIAYEVRAIARKYQLPIFSAVQLNRKSPNKDSAENIGLSRLSRSSVIATHATHVIQIENRVNEELYPDFLYHIIKNRKGPKGKGSLIKNLSCATLLDIETEYNDINDNFTQYDISDEIEDLEL